MVWLGCCEHWVGLVVHALSGLLVVRGRFAGLAGVVFCADPAGELRFVVVYVDRMWGCHVAEAGGTMRRELAGGGGAAACALP